MVYVDPEMCKSCRLCVNLCPKHVFTLSVHVNKKGYNYAQPTNLDACVSCGMCEKLCPDLAVYVERDG